MNLFPAVEGGALGVCTGVMPWAQEIELDKGAKLAESSRHRGKSGLCPATPALPHWLLCFLFL